jgi:hypothetical protein
MYESQAVKEFRSIEAVRVLVGIELRKQEMLDRLQKAGLDFTDLTDKIHTDEENRDITDAIGLILGMKGEEVFNVITFCHEEGITYVDDVMNVMYRFQLDK